MNLAQLKRLLSRMNVTGDDLTASDDATVGDDLTVTDLVSCARVTATGQIQGATLVSTGAATLNSAAVTGAATAASVTATGKVVGLYHKATVTNKTADFTWTLDTDGQIMTCDATGGAIAATLPSPAAGNAGIPITFIKTDAGANNVTIATVNGGSVVLDVQYDSVTVFSNGSAWYRADVLAAEQA